MNRIVFGSSNHWTSPYQVGSHAWAKLFASHGWNTMYVSDPITPWHGLFGKNSDRNRERFALWRSGGKTFENGKGIAWVPFSFIAPHASPFFASRWVMNRWDCFSIPPIGTHIRHFEFGHPDILWLDSVRHVGWGKKLNPRRTILRLADWTAGFSSTPKSILETEKKLVSEADLVITTSETLEERVKAIRGDRPLYTIRNGVDAAFWMSLCASPPEYANIPSPRAIYVGALDEWFDRSLLVEIAEKLPYVSFVIVGQPSNGFTEGFSRPNIYWLGSRPRNDVRALMHHAQVGMIPFKQTDLIECVCPLKLYEYMACGLPVVSTYWEELKRMNSPSRLAKNVSEWISNIQEITLKSEKPGHSAFENYAIANDWQERWNKWEAIYCKIAE